MQVHRPQRGTAQSVASLGFILNNVHHWSRLEQTTDEINRGGCLEQEIHRERRGFRVDRQGYPWAGTESPYLAAIPHSGAHLEDWAERLPNDHRSCFVLGQSMSEENLGLMCSDLASRDM